MASITTTNVNRLIPDFPNEVSRLIILQLSFHELAAGYIDSRAWRDFIDNDDFVRKKMFRLPMTIEAGDRYDVMGFVRDKWRSINAEVGGEYGENIDHQEFWPRVSINPLI